MKESCKNLQRKIAVTPWLWYDNVEKSNDWKAVRCMRKGKYSAPRSFDSEFVDEILEEARKMRSDAQLKPDDGEIPLAQAMPVETLYRQDEEKAAFDNDTQLEDKKQKKKRFGKRQRQQVTAGEDDIYYGLKLKTVQAAKEQRRKELNEQGYDGQTAEQVSPTSTFAYLFEDDQPVVAPDFQEKFRKLHRQRQERIEAAAKEAGEEVEDVFSLCEQAEQTEFTQAEELIAGATQEIPVVESEVAMPQEEEELPVAEELPESVAADHEETMTRIDREELQAEQQNAELRQLIDDALAKETVVEVEHPLHTESIFGLVARERTQDAVEAGLARETQQVSEELQESVPVQTAEIDETAQVNEKLAEQSMEENGQPQEISDEMVALRGTEETENTPVQTAKIDETAQLNEESAELEQPVEENEQPQELADEVVASQEDKRENFSHTAAKTDSAKAVIPLSEPVQYVFNTRPVRTFAIQGIGAILAEEARQFAGMLHPELLQKTPAPQSSKPIPVQIGLKKKRTKPKVRRLKVSVTPVADKKTVSAVRLRLAGKTEAENSAPEQEVAGFGQTTIQQSTQIWSEHERMRLFTDVEEENDSADEFQPELPELEDFTSKENVRSVASELRRHIRTLTLRAAVTGICTVILLALGLFGEFHLFGIALAPLVYASASLIFLAIAMGFCTTMLFHGIKALVTLHANADSAIAAASVVVAAQSVMLLFMQDTLATGQVHVYAALITGGLLLNTAGKLSMVRRIRKNFSFIASNGEKNTVELIENAELAAQMAKDCVAGTPVVAYQKPCKFFANFLKNSYASDCSELTSQVLAPIGLICSLMLFIVGMVTGKSVGVAFTAFAASMCICVPMANMLCVHLPVSRLCRLARKNDSMLISYDALDKFADVNAVMIGADDLFPQGTVELTGMKTFGKHRIDTVLLGATALMAQVGGPLSTVFLEMVKNHKDILLYVDDVAYEDECGVIGWVSGRRILVGNAELMEHYRAKIPAIPVEHEPNQQLVYLAMDEEVVCVFILEYRVTPEKKQEIQRACKNGIGMIIKTTDPCVTAEFIAERFCIDLHAITVLSGSLVDAYHELTGRAEETGNAMLATKGKATCMLRMITACVRERSNISVVRLLQNISVVLGFVLVSFLVCFSGLQQISTFAMVIYQVFWLVVLLAIPKLRRP